MDVGFSLSCFLVKAYNTFTRRKGNFEKNSEQNKDVFVHRTDIKLMFNELKTQLETIYFPNAI